MLAIVGLFMVVRLLFLRQPLREGWTLAGAMVLTVLGLYLFLAGISGSLIPLTEQTGRDLASVRYKIPVVIFACTVGYLATLLEPGLRALALQVEELSVGAIRKPAIIHASAIGFSLGTGLGVVRIISPFSMKTAVLIGLSILLLLVLIAPSHIVGIAFDSASATTGPVNIPILLGIAIGLSQSVSGADPIRHGFGLIALTAFCTTAAVLVMGTAGERL
ncbi:DUF1538 family protein [Pontiellaceae bacterium B12219]|nr:DUF1538 family protein [Pontiellaceae bacterium B12219]